MCSILIKSASPVFWVPFSGDEATLCALRAGEDRTRGSPSGKADRGIEVLCHRNSREVILGVSAAIPSHLRHCSHPTTSVAPSSVNIFSIFPKFSRSVAVSSASSRCWE